MQSENEMICKNSESAIHSTLMKTLDVYEKCLQTIRYGLNSSKNAKDICIKAQQILLPIAENENFSANKLNRIRFMVKQDGSGIIYKLLE